jgi:hypothetical protein
MQLGVEPSKQTSMNRGLSSLQREFFQILPRLAPAACLSLFAFCLSRGWLLRQSHWVFFASCPAIVSVLYLSSGQDNIEEMKLSWNVQQVSGPAPVNSGGSGPSKMVPLLA